MAYIHGTNNGANNPRTVEEIYIDYYGRRAGLIRALTQDVDEFYTACDPVPDKDAMCLYGYPDETWDVALPTEEVPPEIPDPTLGINFYRDIADRNDWLNMVAAHSDAWLYNLAFFFASVLNRDQKMSLFTMINSLPTVTEVVRERTGVQNTPTKDKGGEASGSKSKDKSCEASGSKSRNTLIKEVGDHQRHTLEVGLSSDRKGKKSINIIEESDEENEEEHEESLCGICRELYNENVDAFWIGCDFCQLWFHGDCVNVTPAMAEKIDKYACPSCVEKNQTIVYRT